MNGDGPPVEVLVWGDLACFTRPEMKVERVSYPMMTPSAARGVLESIFWKPAFDWLVREIWALRAPRYFSILRNEVNSLASDRTARGWQRDGGMGGYVASEDRTQRHTLALRGVAYVIRADVSLRPGEANDVAKFRDQFRRRVRRGQCARTPYLGCREFAAHFAEPDGSEQPLASWSDPLGRMLLDIEYARDGSGRGVPRFFDAVIQGGVLRVPERRLLWEAA